MKNNSGEIIKVLRKSMNVSQEELATKLFISRRKLSRVESGQSELSIMEFITAFSVLGYPTSNFWVNYLDSEEFEGYRQYQKINKGLKHDDITVIREAFPLFQQSSLTKLYLMDQFSAFIEIIIDAKSGDNQKLQRLDNTLKMSIPNFQIEEMLSFEFSYNEVLILSEIALTDQRIGNKASAIKVLKVLVNNIATMRVTAEEKPIFLPKIIVKLCELLIETNEHDEIMALCEMAFDFANQSRNHHFLPTISYTMGVSSFKSGATEDHYKPLLVTAYHSARAVGQNDLANKINEEYGLL